MKITKRVVSLVLVLVLSLSLLCVGASAATASNVKQYGVYTCIGDSNAAGYALAEYTDICTRTPGAYHDLVASAVGAELLQFGWGGFRTHEVRHMLDPDFEITDWSYADNCAGKVHKEDLDSRKEAYIQAVADADLITLNVGANDIFGAALGKAMLVLFAEDESNPILTEIKEKLADGGGVAAALLKLMGYAESIGKGAEFLLVLADAMNQAYNEFDENWDAIIKSIYDRNPDVTLVVLSAINPFSNTTLTENSVLKIGKLAEPVIMKLNRTMKTTSAYAGSYLYCDVTDTQLGDLAIQQEDFWTAYLPAVHPTADGHAYIAEQILKLLPEADPVDPIDPIDPVDPNTPSDLNTEDHMAYITGYSDGTVQPNADITRAEVAAIFYRLLDEDAHAKYDTTANGFSDVPADAWYGKAVSTLSAMGVLKGYEDGAFRPDASITRAELAAVAVRFFRAPVAPAEDRFSDIAGHWANEAINAAAQLGIVSGYEDGTFRPANNITRAETIQMVNNVLGRRPDKDHLLPGMVTFSDNLDTSKWYYAAIQEAANSHDYELVGGTEHWTKLK